MNNRAQDNCKNDGKLTDRIRILAKENKTNIKQLEIKFGMSNGTIRRWDSNMPTVDKLAVIAKEFNVTIDYLYYGEQMTNEKEELELISYFRSLPKNIQNNCISYIHGVLDSYKSIITSESN